MNIRAKRNIATICTILIFIITFYVNADWIVVVPTLETTINYDDPNMKVKKKKTCVTYNLGGVTGTIEVEK